MIDRLRNAPIRGVLVGRGALRNPWIFEQAAALARRRGTPREISAAERGRFLLDYVDLLLTERCGEKRRVPPRRARARCPCPQRPARGRERWVINKLRALNSWYTKGLDNGSHLRVAINSAESIAQLREIDRGVLPAAAAGRSAAAGRLLKRPPRYSICSAASSGTI